MTKSETKAIVALAIIGLPIYGFINLGNSMGWAPLFIFIIIVATFTYFYKSVQKETKYNSLMDKYQDKNLVNDLMNRTFWQGQTSEQLRDSLGSPQDIDQKVLKTKKKEVWKYHHQGANRYGLRITLDNDEVVGWDQKS